MAGNGAASLGFVHSFKLAVFPDSLHNSGIFLILNGGLCDKQHISADVVPLCQALLHIAAQALGIFAAVLLGNAHGAVFNLDAGLETQQVGAQSGNGGAAAALMQVFEGIKKQLDPNGIMNPFKLGL